MQLKTLCCTLLLSSHLIAGAQGTQKASAFVTELANKVKANPENPLQINSQTLAEFAEKLPDGQLKYKLLNYSTRLGSDDGLGTRQVYWDINEALNRHPTLASSARYQEMRQSLDLLFNQSDLVVRALKGDLKGIKATDFLNDPAFSTALNKVTGSPNTALGLSMAISGINDLIKSVNDTKRWKQDFKNLAELSKHTVNSELDPALSQAQMQGYVGKGISLVGPNYRYEFKNGNVLMVEHKILTLIGPDGRTLQQLMPAADMADGDVKNRSRNPYLQVSVRPDERYFMVLGGYSRSDNPCKDCKIEIGKPALVDANSGAIVRYFNVEAWDDRAVFTNEGFEAWRSTTKTGMGRVFVPFAGGKEVKSKTTFDLDASGIYRINGTDYKWSKAQDKLRMLAAGPFQVGLNTGGSGSTGTLADELLRSENPKRQEVYYTSSYLQVARDGITAPVRFLNQLTGLEYAPDGLLYVFGANGTISRINITDHQSPDQLYAAIEAGLRGPARVGAYDYTEPQPPQMFVATEANGNYFYEFPQVLLSPDAKHLVYVLRDELYVVDADLSKVRKFQLSIRPSYLYFGRENGNYTLFIHGENDMAFQVCKKYAFDKLLTAPVPKINDEPPGKPSTAKPESSTGVESKNASAADEIAKLKKLLDAGVITKAEFEQGKKKALATGKN